MLLFGLFGLFRWTEGFVAYAYIVVAWLKLVDRLNINCFLPFVRATTPSNIGGSAFGCAVFKLAHVAKCVALFEEIPW